MAEQRYSSLRIAFDRGPVVREYRAPLLQWLGGHGSPPVVTVEQSRVVELIQEIKEVGFYVPLDNGMAWIPPWRIVEIRAILEIDEEEDDG